MRFPIGLAALGLAVWLATKSKRAQATIGTGRRMTRAEVRDLITRINAREFGGWFDPLDVEAIAEIESSFDPRAYRAEPRIGDASIGLMQTLYSVARQHGYTGAPEGLFDPETSVRLGMKHLRWTYNTLRSWMNREPTKEEWIGGYNAGVGNVYRNGYIPLAYINKFIAARQRADDA
jgi:soluble lytic murein transglycosylase-like protein